MKPTLIDIAAELARLEALTNFDLRGEWRRLHAMQPPKSLSCDLLLRGITYKIQERALGGLSTSLLRKLTDPDASSVHRSPAARTVVKPGTRLVREWNGETHRQSLPEPTGLRLESTHWCRCRLVGISEAGVTRARLADCEAFGGASANDGAPRTTEPMS